MPEPALIRDYDALVEALRSRINQLNVSLETVDAIGGLPARYTGKLLMARPIKHLGRISLGCILGALGAALVLVEDPEQLDRVRGRLVPRKYSAPKRDAKGMAVLQKLASDGGRKRFAAMSPDELSAHQSHAAKARWRAWRKARATAAQGPSVAA
jgi:hypothetical protein